MCWAKLSIWNEIEGRAPPFTDFASCLFCLFTAKITCIVAWTFRFAGDIFSVYGARGSWGEVAHLQIWPLWAQYYWSPSTRSFLPLVSMGTDRCRRWFRSLQYSYSAKSWRLGCVISSPDSPWPWGGFTQPILHLLAEYCASSTEFYQLNFHKMRPFKTIMPYQPNIQLYPYLMLTPGEKERERERRRAS